jgi:hypothetical protein
LQRAIFAGSIVNESINLPFYIPQNFSKNFSFPEGEFKVL